MHILFLVDPLTAPVPTLDQDDEGSIWSSNALIRLMMRLSVLSGKPCERATTTTNKCAVKFLSVIREQQVLNHLEFARRFQHDCTLNGDFFEPWTQEHFDSLACELRLVQDQQRTFVVDDREYDNEVCAHLGEAIQLAAHRSFVEAGRSASEDEQEDALVVLIAPLLPGARDICPFIEALCTSTSFPTKMRFVWLDSTEIATSTTALPVDVRIEERRFVNSSFQNTRGGGAMVLSLEQVMFCNRLHIDLDTLIQAGCCTRNRPLTSHSSSQSAKEDEIKKTVKNKTPITSKKTKKTTNDDGDDSSEDESAKSNSKKKKKTKVSLIGSLPQKQESAAEERVLEMSFANDDNSITLISGVSAASQQHVTMSCSMLLSLDDFPVKCLLHGPWAYVVCRDSMSSQFLTRLMDEKKMATSSTPQEQDKRRYYLVPTSAGFATLFVAETSDVLSATDSPLIQEQCTEVVQRNHASAVVQNLWWRPLLPVATGKKNLPSGRKHVSVARVSDSETYRRLMSAFAQGIDGVQSSTCGVIIRDDDVDHKQVHQDTRSRRACDTFLEQVIAKTHNNTSWPERDGLMHTLLRTLDGCADLIILRDEMVAKLRQNPDTIDLAVMITIRLGSPSEEEEATVATATLRRTLFSLLGHMSISWRDSLRFSTFLTQILEKECPPGIWGDIQRTFLEDDQADDQPPPSFQAPPRSVSSFPQRRTHTLPPPLFSRNEEEVSLSSSRTIPAIPLVSSTKKRVVLNHFVAEHLSNPAMNFRTVDVPVHPPLPSSSSSSLANGTVVAPKNKLVMKKASTFGGVSSLKRSVTMTPGGMDVKRVRQAQVQETPVFVQATPHRSLGRAKTLNAAIGGARASKQLSFTPTSASRTSMVPTSAGSTALSARGAPAVPPAFRRI